MIQIKLAKLQGRKLVSKIKAQIQEKRAVLLDLGHKDVKVLAQKAVKFTKYELKIRPRARMLIRVIIILAIAFAASSEAVAYLKPREAEVKVMGQAILVSEESFANPEPLLITQGVSAIRSPFLSEKPIDGPISQGFGGYHRGLDITSPIGTPIFPVGPGVVKFAGFNPDGRGNEVIVDHGDGLETLYAHMGKIHVGVGNNVTTEVPIGTVGMTGRTTGPHVHFEVHEDTIQVNPLNLLP